MIGSPTARPGLLLHDFTAMGTSCRVVLETADRPALVEAERWVSRVAGVLTRFDEASELTRLNRSGGRWVEVSPLLREVLAAALWSYQWSDGLVHAGILPSLLATGYRRPFRQGPEPAQPPPPPPPPLPEMLELGERGARLRPGTALDLGGIAKGWMADRLVAWLDRPALANLGGDLFAGGSREWPVLFGDGARLLCNRGAATSSVRHRRWRSGGGWAHHLIDPRTGTPSITGVATVRVVAGSALRAEGVAKQALLLGPHAGRALLRRRAQAWELEEEG